MSARLGKPMNGHDPASRQRTVLRALARRAEVAGHEVPIMGSRDELIRVLASSNGVELAANGVRTFVPGWRTGRDSNPRYPFEEYDGLAIRWFKPLTHLSARPGTSRRNPRGAEAHRF